MLQQFPMSSNQKSSIASKSQYGSNCFDCRSDICRQDFDMYFNLDQPSQQLFDQIKLSYEEKSNDYNFDTTKQDAKVSQLFQTEPPSSMQPRDNFLQQTREDKLRRYLMKKKRRVWRKKIAYVCRQKVAKDRQRIKGRFTSKKPSDHLEKIKEKAQFCPLSIDSLRNHVTDCPES